MFSLIITIISVALVAALALATLYYGGSSFNKSSAEANAGRLILQGQQLLGAAELYHVDTRAWPVSKEALLEGNYLKEIPATEAAAWDHVPNRPVFLIETESADVCAKVNRKAYGQEGILKAPYTGYMYQCFGEASPYVTVFGKANEVAAAGAAGEHPKLPTLTPGPVPTDRTDPSWSRPPSEGSTLGGGDGGDVGAGGFGGPITNFSFMGSSGPLKGKTTQEGYLWLGSGSDQAYSNDLIAAGLIGDERNWLDYVIPSPNYGVQYTFTIPDDRVSRRLTLLLRVEYLTEWYGPNTWSSPTVELEMETGGYHEGVYEWGEAYTYDRQGYIRNWAGNGDYEYFPRLAPGSHTINAQLVNDRLTVVLDGLERYVDYSPSLGADGGLTGLEIDRPPYDGAPLVVERMSITQFGPNGEGVVTAPSGRAPSARASLSTTNLDFGDTTEISTQTVRMTNSGDAVMTFEQLPFLNGDAPFTISASTCGTTLAAGASCDVTVEFEPPVFGGSYYSTLAFPTGLRGSPHEVWIMGQNINPVSLTPLSELLADSLVTGVNQPFSFDFKPLLRVSNEAEPDRALATWSVSSGALPAGLSLSSSTGVLAGTPTALAAADVNVVAAYKGRPGQQVYTIRANDVVGDVTQIASAGDHNCVLTTSGGVKCWGSNEGGQIGDGTTYTTRTTPVDVVGLSSGAASVHVGMSGSCAVMTSGALKCWGGGASTVTGGANSITPVDVNVGEPVASVSPNGVTCVLTKTGAVKCWGSSASGLLGGTSYSPTPVSISGLTSGVASISVGGSHACAVTTAGAALCWGRGVEGQLGNGSFANSSTPVSVTGLGAGVASISVSAYNHTCATMTSGAVKCWGNNEGGQLGDGTATSSAVPVNVSGLATGVTRVSLGDFHSCAILASGTVKCWGDGNGGKLGVVGGVGGQVNASSATPVEASLGGTATGISLDKGSACAVMSTGAVKCWGIGTWRFRGYTPLPTYVLR